MNKEQTTKIANEILASNKFWRLPKKTIGNDVYRLQKNLSSLYKSLSNDNDLDMKQLDGIIKGLQRVKSSAKEFDTSDLRKMPKDY